MQPLEAPLVFDTDQMSCFDENGRGIDCRGSGQDGEFKSPEASANNRFRAADSVVEDALTGLIWTQDANPAQFPLSWAEAFQFIAEMNASKKYGIKRWRLPDRRELFSLVSHQYVNPCLTHPHPFHNSFPGYYWTRSPCARLPDQAWYVHFGGGRVQRGMKHGSYLVWPVWGPDLARHAPTERLIESADGIYDRLSEKFWLIHPAPEGAVTWQAALDRVRQFNQNGLLGHHDWRLPHIRELEYLVDLHRHSPALSAGIRGADLIAGCWSATTSVYNPAYAWVLYLQDGAVGVGYKPNADFNLWAVRA